MIETNGRIRVRHRLIAQKISTYLSRNNNLVKYYSRLAYIASIRSLDRTSEQKRMKRLLRYVTNHEILLRISQEPHSEVEELFCLIENFQKTNHHFWLQRGCFQLAVGNLNLAENYLKQAEGLNNDDPLVILSLEHLKFKKVILNPNVRDSLLQANEAYESIVQIIENRGKKDPYPYHILGVQGLKWARKGIKDIDKRRKYLEELHSIIENGLKYHPRSREIKDIKDKLHREILSFAIQN